MKILFNSNITEVRVYEKHHIHDFHSSYRVCTGKRKVGRRFFGLLHRYEKVTAVFSWNDWGNLVYWGTVEEYNDSHDNTFFEGDKLYDKPHCEIHMNNGKYHTVQFKTVEELTEYVQDLQKNAPHTIIK